MIALRNLEKLQLERNISRTYRNEALIRPDESSEHQKISSHSVNGSYLHPPSSRIHQMLMQVTSTSSWSAGGVNTTEVICARGSQAWNHPGNRYVRDLAERQRATYANAATRLERTLIVSEIVRHIRTRGRGFLRQEERNGPWVEVGDILAREKVGQLLRNGLSAQYRSSAKAKHRRRRQDLHRLQEEVQILLKSNPIIHQTMHWIRKKIVLTKNTLSDTEAFQLFDVANQRLLNAIKDDSSLRLQYETITPYQGNTKHVGIEMLSSIDQMVID